MSKSDFEPVTETGWRMGFNQLVKKELKTWFGTSAWWQQGLLWTLILVMFGSVGLGDPEAGLFIFYMMATIFPSTLRDLIAYSIILLILTFRPHGFFGEPYSAQLRL